MFVSPAIPRVDNIVVLPVVVNASPMLITPATPRVDNIVVLPDVVNAFPIKVEPVVVNEFKFV